MLLGYLICLYNRFVGDLNPSDLFKDIGGSQQNTSLLSALQQKYLFFIFISSRKTQYPSIGKNLGKALKKLGNVYNLTVQP